MENQIATQSAPLQGQPRDIHTVTTEIRSLVNQAQQLALVYAIEIGRRLQEAKGMLGHGEWGTWLKENVPFSQSTANNLMKIFDEYGADQIGIFGAEANSQTLGNLPYTKALKLLAIPADEREEFVEENDVEHLSSRELEALIKERDAAKGEANSLREELETLKAAAEDKGDEAAQFAAREKELQDQLEAARKAGEDAKAKLADAKAKIKKMQDSTEIPKDLRKKLRAEFEKESAKDQKEKAEKAEAEYQRKLENVQKLRRAAEASALEAQKKAEDLERQLKTASPAVAVFQAHFEQVQVLMGKCKEDINKARETDPDLAGKFAAAMKAAFDRFLEVKR